MGSNVIPWETLAAPGAAFIHTGSASLPWFSDFFLRGRKGRPALQGDCWLFGCFVWYLLGILWLWSSSHPTTCSKYQRERSNVNVSWTFTVEASRNKQAELPAALSGPPLSLLINFKIIFSSVASITFPWVGGGVGGEWTVGATPLFKWVPKVSASSVFAYCFFSLKSKQRLLFL